MNSSGAITALYVYGVKSNTPDYVTKGSTKYQVVSNHIGSPVQVINTSTGAITQEIHYDVWGSITSDTSTGLLPFDLSHEVFVQYTRLKQLKLYIQSFSCLSE